MTAAILASRGTARKLVGDFAQAFADLNKSVQVDASSSEGFRRRGDLFLETGKFDSAIENYTTALQLDETNVMALLWRGIAYGLSGDIKKANSDLNGKFLGPSARGFDKYAKWVLGFAALREGRWRPLAST